MQLIECRGEKNSWIRLSLNSMSHANFAPPQSSDNLLGGQRVQIATSGI